MHIQHTFCAPHTALFNIDPSHAELPHLTTAAAYSRHTLTHRSFRFLLPDRVGSFDAVHPDVWALAVCLVVFPFVRKELRLSFAVSSAFAKAVEEASEGAVQVYPVDATLVPRERGPTQTVAFNGRPHATATAAVVGTDARLVAVDHWNASAGARTSPYPADALYFSLDAMEQTGYDVALVKTDAASVCEPYGFAMPLTACVGNVVLADLLQIGDVYVGARLCDVAAYGDVPAYEAGTKARTKVTVATGPVPTRLRAIGFQRHVLWTEPTNAPLPSPHTTLSFWIRLFGAVGLRVHFPLCGMCDTALVRVLHARQLWANANYCLYARPKNKCGECPECVYYDTIHRAMVAQTVPPRLLPQLWETMRASHPEAVGALRSLHIPNRWHLFWMFLATRRDLLPESKRKRDAWACDVLHAYSRVFKRHCYSLHAGMMPLVAGPQRDRIVRGLEALFRL